MAIFGEAAIIKVVNKRVAESRLKHELELKRDVLLRWTYHHMNGTFDRYSLLTLN